MTTTSERAPRAPGVPPPCPPRQGHAGQSAVPPCPRVYIHGARGTGTAVPLGDSNNNSTEPSINPWGAA